VISAIDLTRRFGSHTAVQQVSFEVGRSEIVALLGPNGAGKTTTMRMLVGLIGPTSGSVLIDGMPLTPATGTILRRRIGFLPEAPGLWERLTLLENLRIYAGLFSVSQPERAIERAMETFELSDRASTLVAELSKGFRQKIALARALLHDPAILVLDEPTSGLDPEVVRSVRHLLDERRAAGCAILVSTHNLDEAERLADRVAVLQRRLLVVDRPAALRRRLGTGRLLVRTAGPASAHLPTARAFDAEPSVDDGTLAVKLQDPDRDTPALVRALVAAGADVLEVRPEVPALEDVYLHLMADDVDDTD
jgi:ABC-2 type transport system ATP-binding protein